MKKNWNLIKWISLIVIFGFMMGCVSFPVKPSESNFKVPTVSLSHVEVEHYWGYWYFTDKAKPVKGEAGVYGAPLDLAFIFEIENPNSYPVLMESLKFTVGFEQFDLNTGGSSEAMWIPAGKTNEIRVHAMFDAHTARLSLLVASGFKVKETGKSPWDLLEKWWTGAPEFSFPVNVSEGAAVFKAGGVTKVAGFKATFP
ncbi:MAG TPA: hypothetical protein HPQ03_17230 [Deltaproteobacteria bacterium]|nr:hypothetical protein [Deltaproteobacteria bacterium]